MRVDLRNPIVNCRCGYLEVANRECRKRCRITPAGLGFNHFAAAQAGRADADPFSLSVDFGVHWTQVDVPAPLGHVVGVADAVSRLRLLAANFTLLCHGLLLPKSSDLVRRTLILQEFTAFRQSRRIGYRRAPNYQQQTALAPDVRSKPLHGSIVRTYLCMEVFLQEHF
jgi:hypothetical protein